MNDAQYTSSRNSFHLLRFVLAAMVIFCHSHTLLGRATPLSLLSGTLLNEGAITVDGFLVISGFLICQSAVRSRNALTFLSKRLLRILPGFCCALMFSVILGALAYDGSVVEYVRLRHNGPLSWMLNWLTLNVQPEQAGVTGVFVTNPVTSLNMSLWTIRFQLVFYALMALLMLTTLNRRRPTYIVLYASFLLLRLLYDAFGLQAWDIPDTRWWLLSRWNYDRLTETGLFFFSGTLLYAYRQEIPRRWYLAVIASLLLAGSCVFRNLPGQISAAAGTGTELLWQLAMIPLRAVYCLALPYLIVYLGASPMASRFAKTGDLSYGMYLFSYPVQQMVIFCAPGVTPMALFGTTMLIILPLAAFSWRCVEAPALRLKNRNRSA